MNSQELHNAALEIRILAVILAKIATRALEQHPDLAEMGITRLQHGIIYALSDEERTISDLGSLLMVDPSTLVPAVDALERKALVKRGRDPNDRRRIPLSLTKRGREFASCVPTVGEDDPLLVALEAMGDERSEQFLAMLRELIRHTPKGEEVLRHVSARVRSHPAIELVRENGKEG